MPTMRSKLNNKRFRLVRRISRSRKLPCNCTEIEFQSAFIFHHPSSSVNSSRRAVAELPVDFGPPKVKTPPMVRTECTYLRSHVRDYAHAQASTSLHVSMRVSLVVTV